MSRPNPAIPSRAGLTLVELLLALAVTALMGLAIGSMLSMVGSVAQADREGRSLLLRAQAGQVRLRAYVDGSLCVLQNDTDAKAIAVWLQDENLDGNVNLTEFRVLWLDPNERHVLAERVVFPDDWTQLAKDAANVVLVPDADFVAAMDAQRLLSLTSAIPLLAGVEDIEWTLNGKTTQESTRASLAAFFKTGDEDPREVRFAFGLAKHDAPGD